MSGNLKGNCDREPEVLSFARVPEFTCHVAGCCQVFDVLEDYEHHYHTLHRNVCSFCKRAFPSGHLLDTHILEWHDSLFQILAERQDMVGDVLPTEATGSHHEGLFLALCLGVPEPGVEAQQGGGVAATRIRVGDAVSVAVSVLGGGLPREVQNQQRQEGAPGDWSPLPRRLPLR